MVKKLTLEDRRKIEQMWKDNASPLKIAAELGISQCTVYTELKRGQETDERTGETVLDHNFRPEYKAERGEKTYQSNRSLCWKDRGTRSSREIIALAAGA